MGQGRGTNRGRDKDRPNNFQGPTWDVPFSISAFNIQLLKLGTRARAEPPTYFFPGIPSTAHRRLKYQLAVRESGSTAEIYMNWKWSPCLASSKPGFGYGIRNDDAGCQGLM